MRIEQAVDVHQLVADRIKFESDPVSVLFLSNCMSNNDGEF
jgi:hypothetical protein